MSMLPLGFLIFPPIVTALLDLYSWREANLFVAVVNIQVSISSCLLKNELPTISSIATQPRAFKFRKDHNLGLRQQHYFSAEESMQLKRRLPK